MTAEEMFNELTWISDSWDGERISFDKDRLEGYLKELETKLQNTSSNSEYMSALETIIKEGVENEYAVQEIVFAVQRLNQRS
jgi:hypothetical protein